MADYLCWSSQCNCICYWIPLVWTKIIVNRWHDWQPVRRNNFNTCHHYYQYSMALILWIFCWLLKRSKDLYLVLLAFMISIIIQLRFFELRFIFKAEYNFLFSLWFHFKVKNILRLFFYFLVILAQIFLEDLRLLFFQIKVLCLFCFYLIRAAYFEEKIKLFGLKD